MSNTPPARGPGRWERGVPRVLASTRILDLTAVPYRHPERETGRDFVVLSCPDWVQVVALTPDGRLVLVNQFRFGTDAFSLELPGGVIEAGEDPVTAGSRELLEETGFAGEGARLLASVHPNPAIQNNRCHCVFAPRATFRGGVSLDPDEDIEVVTAPAEQVLDWAREGRITHALTLAALFAFEPLARERGGRLV